MHPQHHLHPIAPAPPGFHHGSGSGPILPLKAKEPEILESNESSVPQKNKKSPAASGNGTGTTKRRKVNHACLYCRRSHMHCDEARPCQRCVKRDIGHLCKDEPKPKQSTSSNPPASPAQQQQSAPPSLPVPAAPFPSLNQPPASLSLTNPDAFQSIVPFNVPEQSQAWPLLPTTPSFAPDSTTVGNEFSVLSEFLESLDDRSFFANPSATNPASSLLSSTPLLAQQSNVTPSSVAATMFSPLDRLQSQLPQQAQISPSIQSAQTPLSIASDLLQLQQQQPQPSKPELEHVDPLPPTTKTERYLMTAADQESGTRDERLAAVIHSKYEAGLLKPYNYVKGYARLSRWMERNVSPESRQAILQPISVLRPKFRAIAQNLTDIDLVFVEEAFERMLLDYDRVFSAMGIPACLWRRTGEIYKGNKQFADLVGVDVNRLREGRLCIYELMSEDSAVNYWEKYGHVAFDPSQKAVLTSCVLRYKPKIGTNLSSSASASGGNSSLLRNNTRRIRLSASEKDNDDEDIFINCCFSFTIRRDMWGIPSMIVGNFIKC